MNRGMNIGEAARAAGITAKTIRHYEQMGLVPAPARTDAGYRQYGERDVSVLRFIRQSRRLGFPIQRIAGLLGLWSDRERTSREVKAVAQQHLDDIAATLRELAQAKAALERLVASCHGSDDPQCAILATLAAGSPGAPPADFAGAPAPSKAPPRRSRTGPAAETPAAPAPHADLMAWARLARAAAGPGVNRCAETPCPPPPSPDRCAARR